MAWPAWNWHNPTNRMHMLTGAAFVNDANRLGGTGRYRRTRAFYPAMFVCNFSDGHRGASLNMDIHAAAGPWINAGLNKLARDAMVWIWQAIPCSGCAPYGISSRLASLLLALPYPRVLATAASTASRSRTKSSRLPGRR